MTAVRFWRGANRVYDRVMTFVLVVILVIVGFCMYDNYWVYSHTIDKSVRKYKPTEHGYDPGSSPITEDMVGWLTIDKTNIDYPVMQAKDNVRYLNTDPFGDYSLSGSIFLDSGNSPDFSDDYSLIYGHHMEYGKMFGALDDFLDESYFRAHTSGTLIIGRDGTETHRLKVFASMEAKASDSAVFNVRRSGHLQFIKASAKIFAEEPQGRIVAFSTCAEGDSVSRIAVFCYIID